MVVKTGGERPEPTNTSLLDDAALDLNRWSDFASDADVESWAYGASWTVMDAVAEEIGIEGLASLVQAATNDRIAYVGDADPESERGRHDWRLFLDLAQNQNPESADELLELLSQWVLTDRQEDGLEEREVSRAGYDALVTAGDGWAPPLALREAMAEWRFDDADELAQTASSLIADRDALTELLAPVGAALPTELEAAYESAPTDLVEPPRQCDASRRRGRRSGKPTTPSLVRRVSLTGSGSSVQAPPESSTQPSSISNPVTMMGWRADRRRSPRRSRLLAPLVSSGSRPLWPSQSCRSCSCGSSVAAASGPGSMNQSRMERRAARSS